MDTYNHPPYLKIYSRNGRASDKLKKKYKQNTGLIKVCTRANFVCNVIESPVKASY